MAVVFPSLFRDSCEDIGNRYFKISAFPCVWIFLRCLHEEEVKGSSCLELQGVSRAVTSSLLTWIYYLIIEGSAAKDTAQSL